MALGLAVWFHEALTRLTPHPLPYCQKRQKRMVALCLEEQHPTVSLAPVALKIEPGTLDQTSQTGQTLTAPSLKFLHPRTLSPDETLALSPRK